MSFKTLLLFIVGALLLAACGGGEIAKLVGANAGSGTGTGTGGTTGTSNFVAQPPKPLTVTPVLDATHAVTTVVPLSGGTISATGADGSTYTLVIPVNALSSETQITMTPVTAVGGVTFDGGMQAAVQLEPDGLQLMQAATLTIVPARSVPPAQQIGFGYHGAGSEFHAELLAVDPNIVFNIIHFSGYGAGQGNAGNLAQIIADAPTATIEQYQNAIAALLAAERASQLAGNPPDPNAWSKLFALLQGFEADVVLPAIQNALASSDLPTVNNAIVLVLGFERDLLLLGGTIDTTVSAGLTSLFRLQLELAVAQDYDKCLNQHDLSAIGDLLGYAREAALMGNESVGDAAMQLLFKCAKFELDIDSTFTVPADGGETANVKGAISIVFDVASTKLTGQGSVTYTSCSGIGSGISCAITAPTIPVRAILSFVTSSQRAGFLTDADLVVAPSSPGTELAITATYPDGTTATIDIPFWSALFVGAHQSFGPNANGAAEITGWNKGSGAVLFTQTIQQTFGVANEDSTLSITHTPSP